mgnify:CR=1 FL=1
MKLLVLVCVFILSLLLQIFLIESWQVAGVTANVVLAFLIVSCLFIPTEQIIWLGLFGGLVFDFYTSADFGFNMGFYILVIIISKFILKLGDVEHSWWKPVLFAFVVAIIQGFLLKFSVLVSGVSWGELAQIISYGLLTGLVAVVWYLVLSQLFEFAARFNLRGVFKNK